MSVPRITVAPGYDISRIVKGGWQLAGGHGAVDAATALEDMARFVDAGITTFDCADIYTGVEALIGRFLAGRGSGATPVQVHTKYVPDRSTLATCGDAEVAAAVDRSLTRLGVERLDLVQFHWWDYDIPRWRDVAHGLVRQQQAGKVRHIGLTNFDTAHVAALVAAGVPVVSHQVQYSLLDVRPAATMAPTCADHGIQLLCYGALAGGFFSERWLDVPEPPFPHANRSLTKYHLIVEEFGGWARFQRLLHALAAVARRHDVALGAVAIRWVLDRPQVAAAIVGATSARHLAATLQAASLPLDDDDCATLDAAIGARTGPAGEVYALERVKAGRHAGIMRYELNAPGPRGSAGS
jgi:aryl-alcohol dehydrogenase-like predicted oxidoreductase